MTSICPHCGARTNHDSRFLTPRYELPCQNRFCGCIYRVGDALPERIYRYFMWRVAEFGWRAA